MIDIHCHILPDVDDGAVSMDEALEMAHMASASGVSAIVATPHCDASEFLNYKSVRLLTAFRQLRDEIIAAEIPLKLYTGAEVLCTDEMPLLLSQDKLLTIASSKYFLVEFYFDSAPDYINAMLGVVTANGLVPVIAHPERYDAVQKYPQLTELWNNMGYVIQINKDSILGRLGHRAMYTAEWILSNGFAHVVASDAHGTVQRTTVMDEIRYRLRTELTYGYAELLLDENPKRIVFDKPVVSIRDEINLENFEDY